MKLKVGDNVLVYSNLQVTPGVVTAVGLRDVHWVKTQYSNHAYHTSKIFKSKVLLAEKVVCDIHTLEEVLHSLNR